MNTYNFFSDPAHGWLEVEIDELVRLGLVNKISHFSYINGEKAYLEEDCDASLFCKTKAALGEPIEFNEINSAHSDSFIRNYGHY
jgi:hypothetical protein